MVKSYASHLDRLTMQPNKVMAYKDDFVPEEAWRVILEVFGSETRSFLYGHTFLLLKPELLARRLSWKALSFLADQGFAPIAQVPVPVSRNAAHHMWRFQWNAATTDRVVLTNMVNAKSDSLLVVLRDGNPGPVPASVKLWKLKGSAHAERRTEQHLRTVVRMHNRMLGFVHTPDEPADLVRELGILMDPVAMGLLLEETRDAAKQSASLCMDKSWRVCTAAEDQTEAHSVHPGEVVERLGSAMRRSNGARAVLHAFSSGDRLPLSSVLAGLGEVGIGRCSWDALSVAAELIQHDRVGATAMLDAKAVGEVNERWAAAGAGLQDITCEVLCNA